MNWETLDLRAVARWLIREGYRQTLDRPNKYWCYLSRDTWHDHERLTCQALLWWD